MLEDKNPFLELEKEEHLESKEKPAEVKVGFNNPAPIGFDSAAPIKKGSKYKDKYPDNFEGKGLRKAAKLCTIFGIIFSSLAMMYFLLPIFSAFIGGVIAIVIVAFMIVSVVCTLGMILMNEGYRNWIGNNMMDVPNFFFHLGENIAKLSPYYLVVAIPAFLLTTAGLVLGIVGQSKHYRFFVSYIIVNAIFLNLVFLFSIIYFASGMNVFSV